MTIRHAVKRGKWQVRERVDPVPSEINQSVDLLVFQDVAWLALFYIKFFALIPLKLGLLGAIKYLFLLR